MPNYSEDFAIIRRVTSGDVDAFETLIARYRDDVFRIVAGHVPPGEVTTVAHDAFVRAFGSLKGYKPQRPFVRWLGTIAIRTCHDFWRKRYRNKEIASCDLTENSRIRLEATLTSNSPDPATAMVEKEAAGLLHIALAKLSATDRMVVTLVHLEEHSTKEAAEMLGISVANVKVRAFRARIKLKAILEEMDPQGGGA